MYTQTTNNHRVIWEWWREATSPPTQRAIRLGGLLSLLSDLPPIVESRGFRYETGYVLSGTTLDASTILQVMIEYECSVQIDVDVSYSTDGGISWQPYCHTLSLNPTDGPDIAETYRVVTAPHILIAIHSTDARDLRILGFHIRLQTAEEIENAR